MSTTPDGRVHQAASTESDMIIRHDDTHVFLLCAITKLSPEVWRNTTTDSPDTGRVVCNHHMTAIDLGV